MTYINKTLTTENRLVKPYLMCVCRNYIAASTNANYQVFNNIPGASFNFPASTINYSGATDYTIANLPAGFYYFVEFFHGVNNATITTIKLDNDSVAMKVDEQGVSYVSFELLSNKTLKCNRYDSNGKHEWINIYAVEM